MNLQRRDWANRQKIRLHLRGRPADSRWNVLLLPEQDGVIVVLNNNTVGYENLLTIASTLAEEYFSEPT